MKSSPYTFTTLILAAIAAGTIGTGISSAQTGGKAEQCPVPTPAKYNIGASSSFEEAVDQLALQGFEVMEYETEGRRIEITGITATGHCLELKFHPASGKETRRERDDYCSPENVD